MSKVLFAGEFVIQLLKELSFAQCLMLQIIVGFVMYTLLSGGSMVGSVLPAWAMATGVSGLAVVLLGAIRMGIAKLGLMFVFVMGMGMVQLGSFNILISNASEHLRDLNDLTEMLAWTLVVLSTLGGLGFGAAYSAWSVERRATRMGAKL